MNTNHYQNFVTEYQDIVMKQFECNGITMAFPAEIEDLTEQDLTPVLCRRKDFRGEDAFTIDCTDCKDMDDAVSVIKTSYGYRLAVHIADVSAYVVPGSDLSALAENRATSVYLPNITVPMLPKVLSNNLCSLNPNEDRNTLSIILKINNKGKVISYEITKGLIRSRLKGDYTEINAIFDGTAPNDVYMKYQIEIIVP